MPNVRGHRADGMTNANKQRNLQTSCWRAWLRLASLVQERGDLPGYPLEFLVLAVVGDEVRE
jgi:hypothetical protein